MRRARVGVVTTGWGVRPLVESSYMDKH